jgi:hypothetical protein
MPPTDDQPTTVREPEQPTRGADRNQDARADVETSDESLLPSLDDGITLLDVDGGRGVRVVQSLVLDHLLMHDGVAGWVDARGYATTNALARLAPSQRLLDRIHVARGFTPYQHHAAIQALPDALSRATNGSRSKEPALVVAPAFDAQYADADTLRGDHGETLQARGLARLSRYSREFDVPVLLTRTSESAFTAPLEQAADHHLRCEQTQFGPRFSGSEFETYLYPAGADSYQTTLSFWRHVLGERASQLGVDHAGPTGPGDSEPGIGRGVLADRTSESFTADPLADARNHSGQGW